MGLYVMSITEMGNCRGMENGCADLCLSVLDDQEKGLVERENMIVIKDDKEKNVRFSLYSSSSESSIGKNSDEGVENVNDDEDNEVESGYNEGKDGAFGSLQVLEEALPIRNGLSNFLDGKSKSYPILAKALASSSIKAIAKPENSYSRKRKFSLAMKWRSGGESKKSANSMRKTLALAGAMNNCPKSTDMRDNPYSEPSFSSLSPQYSQIRQTKFNSSRHKFSFSDSEQCASLEAWAPL